MCFGDLLGLGDHRPGPDYIPYHVEFWRNQWGTTFAFDEAWVTERVTETFERSYRPDGAYRQLLAGAGSLGLWDAQRSIKQPVLIVHGSADPVFAPASQSRRSGAVSVGDERHGEVGRGVRLLNDLESA
jgi:pimeloyl-ACP methyl ester carboxylesterase